MSEEEIARIKDLEGERDSLIDRIANMETQLVDIKKAAEDVRDEFLEMVEFVTNAERKISVFEKSIDDLDGEIKYMEGL